MVLGSEHCYDVFVTAISDYHILDDINGPIRNPYPSASLDRMLYEKNWIDTVQWHLEDLIRDPGIDPGYALTLKRRIDLYNQLRTDKVELIDDYFLNRYQNSVLQKSVRHNSETLGWALDRLSILALKEFHINIELLRTDTSGMHMQKCQASKKTISEQRKDLLQSINWLIEDLDNGRIKIKTYKQLKMYNDAELNPILYQKKDQ